MSNRSTSANGKNAPTSANVESARSANSAIHDADDPAAANLIAAAVVTMAAKGYHGTSVRDIASAAGLAVGSLYNHFGSKHGLLALILNRGMDGLVMSTEGALLSAGTDPAERLRAIVGVHVGRHAMAPLESLLGNTELRSLEPATLEVVITKRDVQQRMFERVIADGVDRGVFTTEDPVEAARFVVSACTAVATWFRPAGPHTADEIIACYQRIALDAVGHREPRS